MTEDVINASPSDTVPVQIELRNNSHYPYKAGCHFVLLDDALKEVLEEIKMPVEEVQGQTNFTLSVPLKVKENAVPCEKTENNKEYYEVQLTLQDHKERAFGETVKVKLNVKGN